MVKASQQGRGLAAFMIPVNDVEARNTPSRALRTLLALIAETRSLPRRTAARATVSGITSVG